MHLKCRSTKYANFYIICFSGRESVKCTYLSIETACGLNFNSKMCKNSINGLTIKCLASLKERDVEKLTFLWAFFGTPSPPLIKPGPIPHDFTQIFCILRLHHLSIINFAQMHRIFAWLHFQFLYTRDTSFKNYNCACTCRRSIVLKWGPLYK